MKYGKHFAAVTGLIAVLFLVVYVLLRSIYQLPQPASAEAVGIDAMFEGHFLLIAFLFALVMGFMLYCLVAFRRRPGDDSDGDHFHGHTGLEIAWTIVPLGLVIFFGVWAAQLLGEITEPKPDEMTVNVVGRQWSWFFEYPELDNLRSDELVLPVDQPILLHMQAEDVLHSFWVPEFRVKQDLVPGQVTDVRVTPAEVGEYRLRCAEMCGLQHATMLAPVRVVSRADFDAWSEEQTVSVASLSPEERGEIWYTQFGCNGCHSLDGAELVGPTWQGLYGSERQLENGETVVADEEYLRRSIVDPHSQLVAGFPPVMPENFEERFSQEEENQPDDVDILEELVQFIIALDEQDTDGE